MEYKYIIVTDLAIFNPEKRKYLFCRKKNDTYFQLPGGHLINDNDIVNNILEIVKNQLNIDIDKNKLFLNHIMIYPNKHRIYFSFKYEYNGEIIDLKKSSYYCEYEWFDINKKILIDDKLKQVVNHILNNQIYSIYEEGKYE